MKPDNEKANTHLACHIDDATLDAWDEVRKKESSDPERPIKWSRWIKEKIDIALNVDVLQTLTDGGSSVDIQELHRENESLKKHMAALERREIGVSLNRVLEIMQGGEYVDFTNIVQQLIDTEAEATYETLTELAGRFIVECDPVSGQRWRVRL